ncbi:hypothetical protein EXU57_21315 [Segetibacter sp. 3557_3]|uniref:outer membrane beta-barrel protein n=1 Tax=Segetibacter sp. 3557_3 TaxID=2547429 RepID=UPI0010584FD3|nr:outer membrane beta-barrel protein [Segetibacter sp. 3557_3]TDH20659.1 hypothetical protein EXU57_21315 [Segetibacter sp. 3557_3]
MKYIFTLLMLLTWLSLLAQQPGSGSVKGVVIDSASRQSLKDGTISILKLSDSTVLFQVLSKADGSFFLDKIAFGNYILRVSFQGYTPSEKQIDVSAQSPVYNMGTVQLSAAPKDLGVVVVKSSASSAVKGDTLEFSVGNIKTKPNANADDLLKKVPGLEVEKDGSVKAQGEQVAKVMVDGKLFFGNDAKMATQNLPADIIDKVQIIDAQSDQSAFTGFDDGVQEKVINIITKKDRRKGYFGKGNLSAGNDGRYGTNVSLNRFNGNRKISVIGQANNTNQENYTISDILNIINSGSFSALNGAFGNIANMGQSGIARTYSGGINYSDVYGTKTEVSGNYRYNNVNTVNQSARLRETFVAGDSSLFNSNGRYGNNRNMSHNFNLEVDHKFDSATSVLVRSSYNRQRTNSFSEVNSFLTRGKVVNQRDVQTINNSLTDGSDLNNNILFRHRFAKRGRTISVNLNQGISESNTDRRAFNYTNDYAGGTTKKDTTNRVSDISRNTNNGSLRLAFTEALSTKSNLELSYEVDQNVNLSDQRTNSYNRTTGAYDVVDTILSNKFKNVNFSQRGDFSYRRQLNKEWNYSVGLSAQQTKISSDNQTRGKVLAQTFNNYFPTATIQYRKNRGANFRFNYRGSTRQPGIMQLQDIVDNTNLLNITRGNPALKQEFSNNFNLRYTKVNAAKASNFIIRVSGTVLDNKISNAITINTGQSKIVVDNVELEPLAQYSKPVNLNGAYNFKGYVNYGFSIKRIKSNVNLSTDLSHSRDVNLVNNTKGFTRNFSFGERVRLTTNIDEHFDLNFSSSSTYNIALYSLRPQQNGNYFVQVFSVEPTYNTESGWIVGADFDYSKTFGQAQGYNQSVPLLNASLSKQLFAKKQGELKLSVFDALNQNKSITRNVEENYIEDVRTNVLQRYFLLSFIYSFRKFGS